MESNQAEEIARSADRITEAVREFSRSVDRLGEYEAAQASVYREVLEESLRRAMSGSPPNQISEEEADALALAAVHRAREEHEEDREVFRPPDDLAVDIWAENRELGRENRARTWKPPRLP